MHVILLLAPDIFLELALNSLCSLHLVHVHVVFGILDLLASLLLAQECVLSALELGLLLLLRLHLVLSSRTKISFSCSTTTGSLLIRQ